jgi:alpha-L-rhamnosidase
MLFMLSFTAVESSVQTTDLKCEYASNPIGLDAPEPQLSWCIKSAERGILQTAYRIIVADSQNMLDQNVGNIWDSGKVNSSYSVGIKYAGPVLKSKNRYYWKVKLWNNTREQEWSTPAFFEMGLLNASDWVADWVGAVPKWPGKVLYFRKGFTLKQNIKKARVYIAGIGYYNLYINGSKVGDHVLDPGVTNYEKRVLYVTYDVNDFLKKENIIGITVAPGWYGTPKVRAQIELTYDDGSKEQIITSGSTGWAVSTGPIISSDIYDGETYNAMLEDTGWNSDPKFKSNALTGDQWKNVVAVAPPGGKLVAQQLEAIKVVDSIRSVKIMEPFPGIYVIDAGRNLAGWASIKVKGNKDDKISLKFAETLYENGTVNKENLRGAKATDTYILKGDGEEVWEPAFTYHGFRYIQIEGFPYKPTTDDIWIKVLRSAVSVHGNFNCSNDLLNRIRTMTMLTEANNLHSIPTDCPQRDERMGWLNDMTVRIEPAIYNFDMSKFYAKWIDDISDTRNNEGSIADTAPFHWGNNPADPVSASYLLLAWQSYNFYGNRQIIYKHYDGLKAWVDFLHSKTKDGIVSYSYWGDWCPPIKFSVNNSPLSKDTPGELMSTGYLYYCSKIIVKMAEIIGKKEDVNRYNEIALQTKEAYNKKFWKEDVGGYHSNNQACNSFSLFVGLVDDSKVKSVVGNLVTDVKKNDYHLTTGNQCTKYLLEMLSEHGYHEAAYRIATQKTYPGWGYMIENGATSLWERWENMTGNQMNSHNHPMMGSIGSWFYKYILGIIPDVDNPGFERFTIRPILFKELDFAEGDYQSVKGLIKSSWRKKAGTITFNVTIPCNATALVYVPAKQPKNVTENNRKIGDMDNVKFIKSEGNYAVFEVGSGTYNFISKY